jgi:hypothetical protein
MNSAFFWAGRQINAGECSLYLSLQVKNFKIAADKTIIGAVMRTFADADRSAIQA